MKENLHMLVDVARLFYLQRWKKKRIAQHFNISETEVKRLVDKAVDKGWVQINVIPPFLDAARNELLLRFDVLKDARVVPSNDSDFIFERRLCAQAAADYFDERVSEGVKMIALGGGNSLFDMINALPAKPRDLSIYPTAIIGRGPIVESPDRSVIMSLLWSRCGGNEAVAYYASILPAEDSLTSVQELLDEHDRFLARPIVRSIYEGMKTVQSVFTGLGPISAPTEYTQYSHNSTMGRLTTIGLTPSSVEAAGEVSYSFFDHEGNTKREWNLAIALGVDQLKKMVAEQKEVVVIAGRFKERALKAALRGRIFNVLITDDRTAAKLVAD